MGEVLFVVALIKSKGGGRALEIHNRQRFLFQAWRGGLNVLVFGRGFQVRNFAADPPVFSERLPGAFLRLGRFGARRLTGEAPA